MRKMGNFGRKTGLAGWLTAAGSVLASVAVAGVAWAEPLAGRPEPGQIGFQAPVTPVMEDLIWLDDFLLVIIAAITLFVVGLMAYVALRFNHKANPKPSSFTHNAKIEVIWTVVPVLILVVIVVPSLRLLITQLEVPESDLTVKVTGNQWNWTYAYPGTEIEYTSFMVAQGQPNADAALAELEAAGFVRDDFLLAADAPLVVPVDQVVHVLVAASDVLHAFAVPSFGVKVDAVPGRINETWFKAERIGTYYGQCSELCGRDHAYMPIMVEVVSADDYGAFLDDPETFIEVLAERRRSGAELAAAE